MKTFHKKENDKFWKGQTKDAYSTTQKQRGHSYWELHWFKSQCIVHSSCKPACGFCSRSTPACGPCWLLWRGPPPASVSAPVRWQAMSASSIPPWLWDQENGGLCSCAGPQGRRQRCWKAAASLPARALAHSATNGFPLAPGGALHMLGHVPGTSAWRGKRSKAICAVSVLLRVQQLAVSAVHALINEAVPGHITGLDYLYC